MWRDDLPTQAAALAYCASLSTAPLVLLIVSLMSAMGLDLHDELVRQVRLFVGGRSADAILAVVEAARTPTSIETGGRVLGLILLTLSASVVVVQLNATLNTIFGPAKYTSQVRAFFFQRALSLLIVMALILLTLGSLVISTVLHTSLVLERHGLWINWVTTLVTFTGLFTALYRFLPDCPPSWRASFKSATIVALLFTLGREPLASFIGGTAPASVYGAASSLILFLLWVYYTSVIIYLGAELAFQFENRKHTSTHGELVWNL